MDAIKLIMLTGLITEIEIAAILLMFRSSKDDRIQRSIALLLMIMGLYYTGLLIHLFWGFQNFTLFQLVVKDIPLLAIPFAANILIEKNAETSAMRALKFGFLIAAVIYPIASSFLYYNAQLTESIGVLNTLAIFLQVLLAGGSAGILYFVFSKKIIVVSTQASEPTPCPLWLYFYWP